MFPCEPAQLLSIVRGVVNVHTVPLLKVQFPILPAYGSSMELFTENSTTKCIFIWIY